MKTQKFMGAVTSDSLLIVAINSDQKVTGVTYQGTVIPRVPSIWSNPLDRWFPKHLHCQRCETNIKPNRWLPFCKGCWEVIR